MSAWAAISTSGWDGTKSRRKSLGGGASCRTAGLSQRCLLSSPSEDQDASLPAWPIKLLLGHFSLPLLSSSKPAASEQATSSLITCRIPRLKADSLYRTMPQQPLNHASWEKRVTHYWLCPRGSCQRQVPYAYETCPCGRSRRQGRDIYTAGRKAVEVNHTRGWKCCQCKKWNDYNSDDEWHLCSNTSCRDPHNSAFPHEMNTCCAWNSNYRRGQQEEWSGQVSTSSTSR